MTILRNKNLLFRALDRVWWESCHGSLIQCWKLAEDVATAVLLWRPTVMDRQKWRRRHKVTKWISRKTVCFFFFWLLFNEFNQGSPWIIIEQKYITKKMNIVGLLAVKHQKWTTSPCCHLFIEQTLRRLFIYIFFYQKKKAVE